MRILWMKSVQSWEPPAEAMCDTCNKSIKDLVSETLTTIINKVRVDRHRCESCIASKGGFQL